MTYILSRHLREFHPSLLLLFGKSIQRSIFYGPNDRSVAANKFDIKSYDAWEIQTTAHALAAMIFNGQVIQSEAFRSLGKLSIGDLSS